MQRVPINLVEPGMVLAKPVVNDAGMPLCAEGTELTAALIERLKRMNISQLTLKGHPVEMGGPAKSPEEQIREMTARFARVQGDPIMDTIREAIEKAILAESMEQRDEPAEQEGLAKADGAQGESGG
ncbi:conserved hypothetical protein [anaerobic digester metagenome]|uniref:Uncharacterized protein n=1 Tax=anaerobic digester metagenome TaxID=1263854 RepID=A0A485LZH3_9ZZZZ